MKTIVTAAVLALAGLAGATGAEAQDHRDRGSYPEHHRVAQYRRHRYTPAPRMERVWVPARYETRFTGTDHCGRPVYASVCICEGHWTPVPDRCD